MFYLLDPNSSADQKARIGLDCARHASSTLRRENIQIRMDYYKGTQLPHLEAALKKQFKYPDRLRLQYEYVNITEMIINELASIYVEESRRKLENSTKQDDDIFAEIIETSEIDSVLKTVNQYTKLSKTVAVRPVFRYGKMQYDIYTPNIFDIIQDPLNPTKAEAIIYTTPTNDTDPTIPNFFGNTRTSETYFDVMNSTGQLYFYWDSKSHIVFTYDIKKQQLITKVMEQEKNQGNVNPYGEIPFVFFRDRMPVDEFFIEGGDDLINANLMLNVKLTELNYLTKMQSFSQPVAKGAPAGLSFNADPSTLITLPADDENRKGIDFKFVSPDAKIEAMHSDIENRLRRIAIRYKLPAESFSVSGNKSSGFSIEMQNVQLSRAIKGDKPLYRSYEKQLFEMTKKVWNHHNPDRKFSEEASLSIDFGEPEKMATSEEKDSHNAILYANGLISRARWAMIENPDLKTIEEAQKYIAEVDKERKIEMELSSDLIMQSGNEGEVNNDEEDNPDGNSSEDNGAQ